jgi:hypothetical protein
MTEITDAEVAEIQWASDEPGKAAVRAAWDKAKQLGYAGTPDSDLDMADVGAIVWAAHVAEQAATTTPQASLTDTDRRAIAHARKLTALGDLDDLRGHYEMPADDTAMVLATALGDAKWILGELVAVITRMDGGQ